MPIVSTFFGITIRMYFDDHPPPHFHAAYQGFDALIAIETGEPIAGRLPGKAARIVAEWTEQHRDDLLRNWHNAQRLEPLERIPGADLD